MDSNTTDQHDFDGALLLTEPHFADEATLLAAQPVVPLDEIKATALSAKRLIFLTIGCALLVGALVATVIYKQAGREQPIEIVNTAVPGAAALTFDEPAPVAIAGGVAGIATETVPEAAESIAKKPEARPVRTVAAVRVVAKGQEPAREQVRDEQFDERDGRARARGERERETDARRYWRRSEREGRRGRGGRDRRSGDDLLRIRDIFEGPRRP